MGTFATSNRKSYLLNSSLSNFVCLNSFDTTILESHCHVQPCPIPACLLNLFVHVRFNFVLLFSPGIYTHQLRSSQVGGMSWVHFRHSVRSYSYTG